jgi:hypothetical protein
MLSFLYRLFLLTVVATTLSVDGRTQQVRIADTITQAGHRVIMHKTGFPAQFYTYYTMGTKTIDTIYNEMLTEPVHFHIIDSTTHKDIGFVSKGITYTQPGKAANKDVYWHAENVAPALHMQVDGHLHKGVNRARGSVLYFTVIISALQKISLEDIKLHFPFVTEPNRYVVGLGRKDILTDTIQWKWGTPPRHSDGTTIYAGYGSVWLMLRDKQHKKRTMPASWGNNGKGGIWIGIKGKSLLEEAYSGPRTMLPGEMLYYNFAVVFTPN